MDSDDVCRTCLQVYKTNVLIRLNQSSDGNDPVSLRTKLQACVPELSVDIVLNPGICTACSTSILSAYQFKSTCLENERILYKYIRSRSSNIYDLLSTTDLLSIACQDINEEHSYSFVERYDSTCCDSSDSESTNEKSCLKLSTAIQSSFQAVLTASACKPEVVHDFLLTDHEETVVCTPMEKEPKNLNLSDATLVDGNKKSPKESTAPIVKENGYVAKIKKTEIKEADKTAPKLVKNPACKIETTNTKTKLKSSPLKSFEFKNIKPDLIEQGEKDETKESGQLEETPIRKKLKPSPTIKVKFRSPNVALKRKLSNKPGVSSKKDKENEDTTTQTKRKKRTRVIRHGRRRRPVKIKQEHPADVDISEINRIFQENVALQATTTNSDQSENKRYHCSKCNKGYNFKSHFDVHLKSHIFKKLYECPICAKNFTQEKYLKTHALLHSGIGQYQCKICLKSLSASTALKRHYRTHTGEKPYGCLSCSKRFTQKVQLAVHMRTHTGFKPFTCNICTAKFSQKSHLMGHIRIHTGEKPFPCDQCPKRFRKTYALQIHKESHRLKQFQCTCCNFLFKDADVFQRHVNKHLVEIANTGSPLLKKKHRSRRTPANKVVKKVEMKTPEIKEVAKKKEATKSPSVTKKFLYKCIMCAKEFSTRFSLKRHTNVHINSF